MAYRSISPWLFNWLVAIAITVLIFASAGCVNNPAGNSNTGSANSNAAATASDSNGSANPREPIYAKEPDQYSETISINVEPAGSDKKVEVPPLQFDFAKLGGDRRAAFQLPKIGQVIYLEHAGLKYIVLPARNQYLELDQATLGVELPKLSVLTPTAVVEHLKSNAKYYKLETEAVNGRPAVKYRFTGKLSTGTAGPIDTDSIVYLDETTGLPVRAEIVGSTPGGAGARIMMQMINVQLNPERASFEVPIGFKKITSQEVRQQVNSLANTMRFVALTLSQQMTSAPSPSAAPTAATSPAALLKAATPSAASPPRPSAPKASPTPHR
jgi:hypothetical protein